MSVETALRLLHLHKASVTGAGRRSGFSAAPRRLEEVQESILRKVAAITWARGQEGAGEQAR
jgi:hypothetical protein